uniref:Integrase_H2C2 domain-containing protein n=1 Tax=Strongyloides venezuelensis TaxID=75913 RepID=A0A0K0FRG3_STRVS
MDVWEFRLFKKYWKLLLPGNSDGPLSSLITKMPPCTFYSKRLHCSSYTPSVLLELRALCNSLLYFKKLVGNAQVIPKSDHKPLINMLTNWKESSHASLARFLPIVVLRYNWIRTKRDLADYINQCSTCKIAVARYIRKNKVNVNVPSRPLQMLAMGVSGSHKISLSGQKKVIGIVDVVS